jgi:hypothetical protein
MTTFWIFDFGFWIEDEDEMRWKGGRVSQRFELLERFGRLEPGR